MVPETPDSCLTAGCFVFYSLERRERNGYDQKRKLKEEKK